MPEDCLYLQGERGLECVHAQKLAEWRQSPHVLAQEHLVQLGDFLHEWWSAGDTVVLQSSGSTGEPKKWAARKEYMLASARMTCRYLQLVQGQQVLLALPLQYIAAKMMVVRVLLAGLHLHLVPAKSHVMQGAAAGLVYDFAPLVPMQAACSSVEELSRIKTILLGGGHIPQEVEEKLQTHPGRIFASYGMTETFSHIALRRINGSQASPAYQALPGVSLRLNEHHCLCITAPHLGIVDMATHDVADVKDDGRFIILGRRDNIINSGGIKLQAEEIEAKLYHACKIACVAVAWPHEQLGHCLVLLWEGDLAQRKRLQRAIAVQLTPYQRPKMMYHLAHLPRTHSGKIARKDCLKLLQSMI